MAHQRIPRFQPPPEAMSEAFASRMSSRMSDMMASSSVAAAERSSLASWSAQNAQSTGSANNDNDDDEVYETTITFGVDPSQATATPVQTDSNGSLISSTSGTGASATTGSTLTTTNSPSRSSTLPAGAASDHASESDYPYRDHNPSNTPAAIQTSPAHSSSGPSAGQIAAAVAIPLLFLASLLLALILLRRRRRRRTFDRTGIHLNPNEPKDTNIHPMIDRSHAKETFAPTQPLTHQPSAVPILTSATNNAYYTGLSTPSSPSRASTRSARGPSGDSARTAVYDLPPPAYAKHAPPGSTPTLPQLTFATDPFMDPVSPISVSDGHTSLTSPTGAALAALEGRDTAFTATSLSPAPRSGGRGDTGGRPNVSRSSTLRSVTSDTYSDTASLYSARAARRSGVGGVSVQVLGAGGGGVGVGRDPFEDPR